MAGTEARYSLLHVHGSDRKYVKNHGITCQRKRLGTECLAVHVDAKIPRNLVQVANNKTFTTLWVYLCPLCLKYMRGAAPADDE